MGTVARWPTDAASGGGHCANCGSPYVTSQALNNSIVHPTFCLYKTKLRLQHTIMDMAITQYSSYNSTELVIDVHNPGYVFWLTRFLPKWGLKLEDNFATSRADVGMEVKIVPRFYQMITERICSRPLSIFLLGWTQWLKMRRKKFLCR